MSPRTKSKKLFLRILDLDGSNPSSLFAERSNTIYARRHATAITTMAGWPGTKKKCYLRTVETASFSSTAGRVDQVQRELLTACSTSRSMDDSLRLSGPK